MTLPAKTPIALIVCEGVYQDSDGKRTLVGLFNQVIAAEFPARQPKICAFVSIAPSPAGTLCKLDIAGAGSDGVVASTEGSLPDQGPVTTYDLVFELRDLVFAKPGTYYVRFWADGQILAQRAIQVVPFASQTGG